MTVISNEHFEVAIDVAYNDIEDQYGKALPRSIVRRAISQAFVALAIDHPGWSPTNPAPVVEGESMVHDLEHRPVAPNHGLNERVAKMEAVNRELTRIMSDLSQKVGRCEGVDTAFGLRLDGLEKRLNEHSHEVTGRAPYKVTALPVSPQPTPTEPEPGEREKWRLVEIAFGTTPGFRSDHLKAAVQRAVELGLVHREPVVIEVSDADVGAVSGIMSPEFIRPILEAYAARLRARQEGV